MKNMKMKSILLLALVVAVLMGTVGGTVAYLVTSTDPVTNTFTPAKFDTDIEEKVDSGVKSKIIVKNTGEVDAWVRVAIIGNYVNEAGQVVGDWNGTVDYNEDNWELSDRYYYYKEIVPAGGETVNLLETGINAVTREDGAHLEITVIHQSIQAEGLNASSAQEAFEKAKAQ